MAGIYIHVPFCLKICYYCDFYKTGNSNLIEPYIKSLLAEIGFRKDFLNENVGTIYFGGGTPSILPVYFLEKIIDTICSIYKVCSDSEITLEVNPDDVNEEYLKQLIKLGITRLSIGIQSFNDRILTFLNRRHNSETAINAIIFAQNTGFENISGDLIYGIPGQEIADFENDLKMIESLKIVHLSAYHLGIEEGTYFGRLKKAGKLQEIKEQKSVDFFNLISEWSENVGFEQYEISSFAKDGKYSIHNRNYWFNIPYLGFGPSAHSYNGVNRFYNITSLKEYLKNFESGYLTQDKDILNVKDRYNEYLLLRLRTKWGIDLDEIERLFSHSFYTHTLRIFSKYNDSDYLRKKNSIIYLTKSGFFVSDFIIREFFIVD